MSLGCTCGSNMSSMCGRNACAVLTTRELAGYLLPPTVNGAVARWTTMPVLISALANFVAVRKSRCSDEMMYPRGSRSSRLRMMLAYLARSAGLLTRDVDEPGALSRAIAACSAATFLGVTVH